MKLDLICEDNDEYYTPEYAITPLLKYLKPQSIVWCPFDTTQSNFVKMLNVNNHNVISSHITDNKDFFTYTPSENINYIISNPPYSLKNEVLERLFKLQIPFAMLMGVVGIFESKFRFDLFKHNKFEVMYFNKRISYLVDYKYTNVFSNPPYSSVYIYVVRYYHNK